MFLHRHFLLEAEIADLAEVVLIPCLNRGLDSASAGTDQDVPHQFVEPASFEMHLVQVDSPLLKDDLLGGVYSEFPLVLHQFNLLVHLLFALHSLLDLFNFLVQRFVQVCDVLLSIVHVLLVVGGELEDLFL